MTRRRRSLIPIAGAMMALWPARAVANDGTISPGLLLSLGNGERTAGFGVEVSGMLPSRGPWAHGAFVQIQTYSTDYQRVSLGLQSGSAVGFELGYAYVTGSELHASTSGIHFALWASAGYIGTAVRLTAPVQHGLEGDLEHHGAELAWVLTLKYPAGEPPIGSLSLGRPLRGTDGIVTASPDVDETWADGPTPLVAHLPATERAALAELWLGAGLAEHASVATFARLVLQLLALGAPPDLIGACQRAALDETRHARLCFALASAYAGVPLGPGPLPSPHLDLHADPSSLARWSWLDGCVEESLGALLAARGRSVAVDPAVADVLAILARDEHSHAELAWGIATWCLEHDRERVGAALADLLDAPPVRGTALPQCARGLPLLVDARHGWPDPHERAVLHRRAQRSARARLATLLGRSARRQGSSLRAPIAGSSRAASAV